MGLVRVLGDVLDRCLVRSWQACIPPNRNDVSPVEQVARI
jgi:hypothetical protein